MLGFVVAIVGIAVIRATRGTEAGRTWGLLLVLGIGIPAAIGYGLAALYIRLAKPKGVIPGIVAWANLGAGVVAPILGGLVFGATLRLSQTANAPRSRYLVLTAIGAILTAATAILTRLYLADGLH